MSLSQPPPAKTINGRHVLAWVVGFFVVVVAVDVGFMTMAIRTFPGQVSVTPYEDGVAYNRTLTQMDAQARLGWRASASVMPDGAVELEVRDRAGAPVTGLKARGALQRPATEQGRLALTFAETAPGRYRTAPQAITGAWDLEAVAVDGLRHRFEAQRRLLWP